MWGGSSRNLGGLVHSTPSATGMGHRQQPPACGCERPYTRRSKQNWTQAARGIARAKETKRGEMVARRRSALIVPMMQGNLTRRDPVEGRGASDHSTVVGQHRRCDGTG